MNPGNKFEEVVAATIKEFNVFSGSNVEIFQRKIYPGAKDPNGYQIDISIELMLTSELFFLIIIECKDHARPVERSVVQQFIQVRDDISAQKAIIVSAKGFNSGAVRLAESNRIALWQWAKPRFYSILRQFCFERSQNEIRKEALINGSISYFRERGIIINKDSLLFGPILEHRFSLKDDKSNCRLILTQISSCDSKTSEDGYIDVDIMQKPGEIFFLDVVNTILESQASESNKLRSYIDSQYEKIHRKYTDFTPEETEEFPKPEIQNFDERKDDKFPWEDDEEELGWSL